MATFSKTFPFFGCSCLLSRLFSPLNVFNKRNVLFWEKGPTSRDTWVENFRSLGPHEEVVESPQQRRAFKIFISECCLLWVGMGQTTLRGLIPVMFPRSFWASVSQHPPERPEFPQWSRADIATGLLPSFLMGPTRDSSLPATWCPAATSSYGRCWSSLGGAEAAIPSNLSVLGFHRLPFYLLWE